MADLSSEVVNFTGSPARRGNQRRVVRRPRDLIACGVAVVFEGERPGRGKTACRESQPSYELSTICIGHGSPSRLLKNVENLKLGIGPLKHRQIGRDALRERFSTLSLFEFKNPSCVEDSRILWRQV